jgi:hypothetical protein
MHAATRVHVVLVFGFWFLVLGFWSLVAGSWSRDR